MRGILEFFHITLKILPHGLYLVKVMMEISCIL